MHKSDQAIQFCALRNQIPDQAGLFKNNRRNINVLTVFNKNHFYLLTYLKQHSPKNLLDIQIIISKGLML